MLFPDEKNKRHKWTEEQKVFICILKRCFLAIEDEGLTHELTTSQCHTLFTAYFADTFRSEQGGKISPLAVESMYREMELRCTDVWQKVYNDKNLENWAEFTRWTPRIAALVGVKICRRPSGEKSPKTENQNRKRDRCQSLSTEGTIPRAKRMKRILSSTSNYLPEHPAFQHFNKKGERIQPYWNDPSVRITNYMKEKIAFRTWDMAPPQSNNSEKPNPLLTGRHGTNTAHGFWCGTFNGSYISPPCRNDQQNFGEPVYIHLRPLEEPSYWVSITISFIQAVHRLIKSKTSQVTIIDIGELAKTDIGEYPAVYSAKDIIKQYRLREIACREGAYRYRGDPELIVWQYIGQEAIINTRSHQDFIEHVRENPFLGTALDLKRLESAKSVGEFRQMPPSTQVAKDYSTGYSVGKFIAFAGIPGHLVKNFADIVAKNWKFFDVKESGSTTYYQGIEAGYGRPCSFLTQFDPKVSTKTTKSPDVHEGGVPTILEDNRHCYRKESSSKEIARIERLEFVDRSKSPMMVPEQPDVFLDKRSKIQRSIDALTSAPFSQCLSFASPNIEKIHFDGCTRSTSSILKGKYSLSAAHTYFPAIDQKHRRKTRHHMLEAAIPNQELRNTIDSPNVPTGDRRDLSADCFIVEVEELNSRLDRQCSVSDTGANNMKDPEPSVDICDASRVLCSTGKSKNEFSYIDLTNNEYLQDKMQNAATATVQRLARPMHRSVLSEKFPCALRQTQQQNL